MIPPADTLLKRDAARRKAISYFPQSNGMAPLIRMLPTKNEAEQHSWGDVVIHVYFPLSRFAFWP